MLAPYDLLKIAITLIAAIVISFAVTPVVMRLAKKVGAVDVPTDNRRMHKRPIPRLGGLAIIFAFVLTSLIILRNNSLMWQILPGAIIIGVLGIVDDYKQLPAWPKFFVQCCAAGIAVAGGALISWISGIKLFGLNNFSLGFLAIPITIIWIVGLTNAVNFIDGLDGLAAGVSTIASISMLIIAVLKPQQPFALVAVPVAVLTAALAGGCIGLLPYNRNPAKIFMGDTGATFIGFTLSIISIQGVFKFYTAISFAVPFLILGLPIFDTAFAILRRVINGKSPFSDRGHLHHKLIDLGLNQKQAVAALYSVSAVLGIVAVVASLFGSKAGWLMFLAGVAAIFFIYLFVMTFSKRFNQENDEETQQASQTTAEQEKNDEQA